MENNNGINKEREIFINVLLQQYKTLRDEISNSINYQNKIIGFGFAAIVALLAFTLKNVDVIKGLYEVSPFFNLIILVPLFSNSLLAIWGTEFSRMMRASFFIGFEVETKINNILETMDSLKEINNYYKSPIIDDKKLEIIKHSGNKGIFWEEWLWRDKEEGIEDRKQFDVHFWDLFCGIILTFFLLAWLATVVYVYISINIPGYTANFMNKLFIFLSIFFSLLTTITTAKLIRIVVHCSAQKLYNMQSKMIHGAIVIPPAPRF